MSDEAQNEDKPNMLMQALRVLGSVISSRGELAGAAGRTYGGNRNMYQVLGYQRAITEQMYFDRYKRNAIAGRIVEALPEATWRGGGEVIENEDPEIFTDFEQAWDELADRLKVWSIFLRADIVAGLGRYSCIFIGAPGQPEDPLPDDLDSDDIKFLSVFSEYQMTFSEFDLEDDPNNERFGLPKNYTLAKNNTKSRNTQLGRKIHWSRIIHIVDTPLDNPLYGQPRLERVWNLLDDLEKVTGGGAEAFWLRANQGMHVNVDPTVTHGVDDKAALQEQVEKYKHGLDRVLRTRGVEVDVLGSDTASIQPNVDALTTLIAGGTKIPKRILTGSEMGELASTQDRSNWGERVGDRRVAFAELMLRSFIQRLIEHGALPEPEDPDEEEESHPTYQIRWPNIQNLDEKERAAIALQVADINSKMGQITVLPNELRDWYLLRAPLKKADLKRNAKLQEAAKLTTVPGTEPVPPGAAPIAGDPDEDDLVDEDEVGAVDDIPQPEDEE